MLSYVFMVALAVPQSSPGDWPQWRGPNRDGVSTETGLLTAWPKDGPKLLWEAKGAGRGYASLAVAGGRIYTLGDGLSTADDKDEYAICFEEATGKPLWKTKLGKPWNNGQANWQGSRSTPTVDGDHIYYMTPQGNLVCLQTTDGKEVWRKSMGKDFEGGKRDSWGFSESPLIDGDHVVVTPGKEKHTMVALNKKTGELVWSTPVKDNAGAGHSSIVISEVAGTRIYVQTTDNQVLGVRAKDGKLQWTYAIKATAVIPTPIVKGDLVLAGAGYSKGCALLRQVPEGDAVTVKEVYGYKKGLANKHGGIVLIGEYIYGCADDNNSVWCAKLSTGVVEEGWKARGSGTGSVAISAADGYLYARFASGVLALVKASPGKYEEVSSFNIPHYETRPSWSHPVIAGGKLYLREGDWIMCYDIKK